MYAAHCNLFCCLFHGKVVADTTVIVVVVVVSFCSNFIFIFQTLLHFHFFHIIELHQLILFSQLVRTADCGLRSEFPTACKSVNHKMKSRFEIKLLSLNGLKLNQCKPIAFFFVTFNVQRGKVLRLRIRWMEIWKKQLNDQLLGLFTRCFRDNQH